MSYQCYECGFIFDEPKKCYGELLEYAGTYNREYWEGCPNCYGNFRKAIICDCCGKYIVGTYIKTIDGQLFCEDCNQICSTENDK